MIKRTSVVGAVAVAGGIVVLLVAAHALPVPHAHRHAPTWFIGILGLLVGVFGVMLALGERLPRLLVALLGCTHLTLFAIVSGWLAFGPGTRQPGLTLGVPYLVAGATVSAAASWMFALATVVLAIFALLAWAYCLRMVFGAPGWARGAH